MDTDLTFKDITSRAKDDAITIFGKILNSGDGVASQINIICTFYHQGEIVGIEESWDVFDVKLKPGEAHPFSLSIYGENVDDYELRVKYNYAKNKKNLQKNKGSPLTEEEEKLVFNHFNNECILCRSKNKLKIYYKNKDKNDTSYDILVVLCESCYKKVVLVRIVWVKPIYQRPEKLLCANTRKI